MRSAGHLGVVICLLALGILWAAMPAAQEVAPAIPADGQLAALKRTVQETAATLSRVRQENAQLRAALQQEEKDPGARVTARMLEQTRLDVASVRAALASVRNREAARNRMQAQLQGELEQLQADMEQWKAGSGEETSTRRAALQAEIASRHQWLAMLQQLIGTLSDLRAQFTTRLSLLNERYLLRQQQFQIPRFTLETFPTTERARTLQREIDALLERATRLGHQAATIGDEQPDSQTRKSLLLTQALDAEERVELKQLELRLLKIDQALQEYSRLLDAESVPLSALKAGLAEVQKVLAQLALERQALVEQRQMLAGQQSIVEQRGSIADTGGRVLEQERTLLHDLITAVEQASAQTARLQASTETMQQRLRQLAEARGQRLIFERRRLPPDAEGWKRLASGLLALPQRVLDALLATLDATVYGLKQVSAWQGVVIALSEGALILGALWLRRLLERRIMPTDPGSTFAVPVRSLHFSLLSLLLPSIWLVLALLLELPQRQLVLILAVLLVWPAVRLLLTLAQQLLQQPSEVAPALRQRFYRNLRGVLILVSVLVSLIVVARVVAVSPSVVDIIDRFSMLCLLLIAWPLLQLRSLTLSRYRAGVARVGLRARLGGHMAWLITLVCALAAVLGLAGYVALAWSIAEHLGWLALVFAGWLLLFGALRDGMRALAGKLSDRPGGADFWLHHFIIPAYRLAALGLLVAAVILLLSLFGWSRDTPVIRWIPVALEVPLFSVGDTVLRMQDLLLVVLLVVIVFRAGSWSRQVSFRLMFGRVGDPGIRQSLATFTQYSVIVLGVVITLNLIGLDLTALTVFAGALGVGIGFGLQNIANNFISGILLLAERPLQVADMVTVDNFEGEVTHIGIRSLTVQTWDNQQVVIPNSAVISQPFINWTRGDDIMRTVLMVGISYDSDPHQAAEIIEEILHDHPAVLSEPVFSVLLWEFADSAVVFRVTFYSHLRGETGRLELRSRLLFSIWDKFAAFGIQIPYPQRDIYIRSLPEGGLKGR